ncbi:hypothetical protein SJ300_16105, partial [Citrobacter portucalensis]|nr:hypothetical protein [Citrobacter portucalensis]
MLNSRTYLYQRNGVFYIRLRMKTTGRLTASLPSHNRYKLASVSLRTKDRRTAMAHSRHIKSALKAIHAVKWFTEFGHLNRGDMLTSEQHRCHNE